MSTNNSIASWNDVMKDTTVHALDIETTSTQAQKAKIYNIGTSHFTPDGKGGYLDNSTEHFITGIGKNRSRRPLAEQLLRAHNTPNAREFAEKQKARGIFDLYAADVKNHTTIDHAMNSFSRTLANTDGKSFILGQNLNFENQMFKAAIDKDDAQGLHSDTISNYNTATGRASKKNASTELFKEYADIEDTKKEATGFFRSFKAMLRNRSEVSDEAMKTRLGEYTASYDKVVDSYKAMIAKSAKGNIPIVDLMDITRATYAHAALRGDMGAEFINHGSSINFLLQHMFDGRQEQHIGTSDNKDALDIFNKLTSEYDKYKADPTYRSPVLQKINKAFTETNELHSSYVRGVSNSIEEISQQAGTTSIGIFKAKAKKRLNDSLISYDYINQGRQSRSNIHQGLMDALETIPENVHSVEGANTYLSNKLKDLSTVHEAESFAASNVAKTTVEHLKNKLLNKKVLIGVGSIVAANLLFSSGTKDQGEYNTYDELYNSQYYGSQFADWQDRNKHHKMSY